MSYTLQSIFSVLRLTVGFLFVFGFITPLFLKHAGSKRGIDRIVFSWVGLGGLLVIGVFLLVTLHIYDFISTLFFLLMLPLLYNFFKRSWEGEHVTDIFNTAEHTLIANHVRLIEKFKGLTYQRIKEKILRKPDITIRNPYSILAVITGIVAAILRIIPSIENASPFSRIWYFELDAVKNLSLQTYFSGTPTPKGMHSIIHFFSTITQVSPEMILHSIGALISFFLTIIIFWVIRDITRGRHPAAALFGALLFGVFPASFLPVSMELQSELTSLSVALCFAIPTMVFFLRNIRSKGKTPWFYIFMGIAATGLCDIFVLLMVLLPFMIVGLISLPHKGFFKIFGKNVGYIILVYVLTLLPYVQYCVAHRISVPSFFRSQLFNTQVFTLAPNLLFPIEELSQIYLYMALVLILLYTIRYFVLKKKRVSDEIVFLVLFAIIAYLYTPYFDYLYLYIDPDQLNSFYGIMISIFAGLVLYSIFIFLEWAVKGIKRITPYLMPATVFGLSIGLFVLQGGFKISRMLPETQPNGFFAAYYEIIDSRIPYTYAIVGPELDRELAVNRHYFMNYRYFLNNYGAIDSLYQQYLTIPDNLKPKSQEVPPASIFLFVEKPPYGSIQQGILYDAPGIMRDMEQWLISYKRLKRQNLRVYYESDETIVYEIVNRKDESTIKGVLKNIYPKGKAIKLFKK